MRMQTISTWCDNPKHGESDANLVSAESFTISVNGATARGIDLCEECYGELLAPLVGLIDMEGHSLDIPASALNGGRSKNSAMVQCPYCDRKTPTEAGMRIHRVRIHKDLITPSTAKPAVPVEESIPEPEPDLPYVCSECDRRFKSINAVSGHQLRHKNEARAKA